MMVYNNDLYGIEKLSNFAMGKIYDFTIKNTVIMSGNFISLENVMLVQNT